LLNDTELDAEQPGQDATLPVDTVPPPSALDGFRQAGSLLEFDQIRQQLAAYTRTVVGRERAMSLTPSQDVLEIATRQQETTEARQFLEQSGALEFGPEQDFRELLQRALLGGLLRGIELYAVRELAGAARYDRSVLARQERMPMLARIAGDIPDVSQLERDITGAISPAGEVLDHASPVLGRLRIEARQAQNRLNEVMERNLRRLQRQELVQEPLITQRNGRMVLLIKTEMRPRVPGIVHDVSDTGATVFVEPMQAVDLGNRWREARLAQEREEERVLRQLSGLVGESGEDLLLTLDLVARLDLNTAKARYSAALKAVPPWLASQETPERSLKLVRARHPLLPGMVVPVTVELGTETGVMLITGPNAGGKTVALKTVGLLAIMAHAGLHVPADEAHFPCFDGVYADIGDQQSIQQSLSTFSSHMTNLISIMNRATVRSLVLADELGASTDPEEGSALASGILRYFRDRGVFLVATTHHRGVARTAQEQPGMVNASVDLDPGTLEPTYHLTLGMPGRSYALTIAARLGIPGPIIEDARSGISPAQEATDNLLHELQQERLLAGRLREEAEEARTQAARQQRDLEEQLSSVESAKAALVEEARQELQDRIAGILDGLRRAERLLESPETPVQVQQQRAEIREVQRQLESTAWQPIEVKRSRWQESLREGDRVYVRGISQPVEVITPPDEQDRVEVLLGAMRAKIPVYQLERRAEGHAVAARQGVYLSRTTAPRRSGGDLDLRGLRVDDAVAMVEAALNNAALDGVGEFRIIHGKGTGALRRAVREYLADHPLVVSAANGEGPGGDGVTVVEIR
jgi:DNA mismatch repair protein MutS2